MNSRIVGVCKACGDDPVFYRIGRCRKLECDCGLSTPYYEDDQSVIDFWNIHFADPPIITEEVSDD